MQSAFQAMLSAGKCADDAGSAGFLHTVEEKQRISGATMKESNIRYDTLGGLSI
jgi:hypothetical protein